MTKTVRNVRMNDGLLTAPTPAELEAWQKSTARMAALDLGIVWDGISGVLDALQPAAREQLLKQLDAYRARDGRTMGMSAEVADARRESEAQRQQLIAINKSNQAFWDERAKHQSWRR